MIIQHQHDQITKFYLPKEKLTNTQHMIGHVAIQYKTIQHSLEKGKKKKKLNMCSGGGINQYKQILSIYSNLEVLQRHSTLTQSKREMMIRGQRKKERKKER